jgi:hypothetical protein
MKDRNELLYLAKLTIYTTTAHAQYTNSWRELAVLSTAGLAVHADFDIVQVRDIWAVLWVRFY